MQSSSSPEYRVAVFGSTNVGSVRSHNEDNFLVSDLTAGISSLQPEVRNHAVGNRGSLFMVADGMGGGAAGEVASQIAITSVFDRLMELLRQEGDLVKSTFAIRLKEAVEFTNGIIYRESRNNPEYKGMGTTTSAAGFFGGTLYIAQVGDSRAYLVRRGAIKQVTKDQSLVNKLLDAGLITEEEAENHENKNVILQALGVSETIDVVLSCIDVCQGDILVMCSDGLSGLVKAEEMRQVVESTADQVAACRQLIDTANERGGFDNITVIIAQLTGSGLPAPTDRDFLEYTLFDPLEIATTKIQGSPVTPAEKKKPVEPEPPRTPKTAIIGIVMLIALAVILIVAGLRYSPSEKGAAPSAEKAVQPALPAVPVRGGAPVPSPPDTVAAAPPRAERAVVALPATASPDPAAKSAPPVPEAGKLNPLAGVPSAQGRSGGAAEKVRTFEETSPQPAGRNVQGDTPPPSGKEPEAAPSKPAAAAEAPPPPPEPPTMQETAEKGSMPVTITIQTNPPGISFLIDGSPTVLSAPYEIRLKPGPHILKFKFGPLTIEKSIEVRPDSDMPFLFDFETIIKKPPLPLPASSRIG